MTHEDHIAHLEDVLAMCLPYIKEYAEDGSDYKRVESAHYLALQIRKAVPWLKERDE